MVTSGLLLHRDPHADHWVEWRPDLGAVYLRFRRYRGDAAFAAVAQEVLALLDTHDDAPLVVDLRGNPGGASRVIRPLLQGLRERAAGDAQAGWGEIRDDAERPANRLNAPRTLRVETLR